MAVAHEEAPGIRSLIDAPGPGMLRSVGIMRKWRNEDRIAVTQQVLDEYGDVAQLQVPGLRIFVTNNPEIIQECLVSKHRSFHKDRYYEFLRLILGNGLLTSEEDFHLQQRRMVQPAFHKDRIASYAEAMVHYSQATRSGWRDGQKVNMASEMGSLALSIVGKTLFGSEVGTEAQGVADALDHILPLDNTVIGPFGSWLIRVPFPSHRRFFKSLAYIDEVLYKMIKEHRASGDQGDLLSMLLAAQDEDDGHRMNDMQVRNEAITLFLAGHETTAVAMTWTWYLLSQHPDVEARMHEELDRVLCGRTPTFEDYPRLDYTRRVFQESMRLFPPAYIIGRESIEDTTLGGYRIPKGSIVIMSSYITQRDKRYFPNPESFDPDRWLPENSAGRHKFTYFPFGGGRRLCVGEPFAWMEGVLVMATLCQHWKATLDPSHKIGFDLYVTLRPKGGMPMTLLRR